MAFASKSEQRMKLSQGYDSNKSTLNSEGYRRTGDMGSEGKGRLVGKMNSGGEKVRLYGSSGKASGYSGLAGRQSDSGYTSGPKWKRAMEPGELKPGTRAQAGNTTRIKSGTGEKAAKMHTTGATPKALRGGR